MNRLKPTPELVADIAAVFEKHGFKADPKFEATMYIVPVNHPELANYEVVDGVKKPVQRITYAFSTRIQKLTTLG